MCAESHTARNRRKTTSNCIDPESTRLVLHRGPKLLPLFWFLGLQQADAHTEHEHGLPCAGWRADPLPAFFFWHNYFWLSGCQPSTRGELGAVSRRGRPGVGGKARPVESCSVTGLRWRGDDIALLFSLDLQNTMIPAFSISPLHPQQRPAFHFGSLPHTASAASLPTVILEKTWASSSGEAHCFLTASNWCSYSSHPRAI